MKKFIYFIMFLSFQTAISAQTKVDGFCVTLTDPVTTSLTWSDDSISFAFIPSEYFWDLTILNNTSVNMTIIWDETLFIVGDLSSKVIFSNTKLLFKNEPLHPGIIAPGTKSLKSIMPLENIGNYVTSPVYSKKMLKRNGERTVTLIIPILTRDNRHDYKFNFKIVLCE